MRIFVSTFIRDIIFFFIVSLSGFGIMICPSVCLFGFLFFESFCDSHSWISVSFRFWKFSAIISSNTFSPPFSFSSPYETLWWEYECVECCPRGPLNYSHFLKFCLPFAVLIEWFKLFYFPDYLGILLSPNLILIHSSVVLFHYFVFQSD